jgi:hypothetical protein
MRFSESKSKSNRISKSEIKRKTWGMSESKSIVRVREESEKVREEKENE